MTKRSNLIYGFILFFALGCQSLGSTARVPASGTSKMEAFKDLCQSACPASKVSNPEGYEKHPAIGSPLMSTAWTEAVGALTLLCGGGAP